METTSTTRNTQFNPAAAIAQLAEESGLKVMIFSDGPFPLRSDDTRIVVMTAKSGIRIFVTIQDDKLLVDIGQKSYGIPAPPDYLFNLVEPDSLDRLGEIFRKLAV